MTASTAQRSLTRTGFTLVELAIVLVLIALMIGTVLTGQAMLRNQRLNRIGIDAAGLAIATQQFKTQYGYLPGDYPEAYRVWGDTYLCQDALSMQGSTSACNGDGNGMITHQTGTTKPGELLQAWQHLGKAGLINATGTTPQQFTSPLLRAKPGTNVPAGPFENTGYAWYDGPLVDNAQAVSTLHYDGNYTSAFTFGAPAPYNFPDPSCAPPPASCGGTVPVSIPVGTEAPAISGAEASLLDTKIDDGAPQLGNIRSFKDGSVYAPYCAVNTGGVITYRTDNSYPLCSLIFMNSFEKPKQ